MVDPWSGRQAEDAIADGRVAVMRLDVCPSLVRKPDAQRRVREQLTEPFHDGAGVDVPDRTVCRIGFHILPVARGKRAARGHRFHAESTVQRKIQLIDSHVRIAERAPHIGVVGPLKQP